MPRTKKNTPPPRVSVLMANYNGERFLGLAIASILDQSYRDFEFIVVDDGSTDKSVSLLSSYARRDKRIRAFYFPQNRGFARALNYGLGFAQGEYVARMDSDDLCHRDRLLRQVFYLDKHRDIHVLGCGYRAIDEGGSFCSAAYARRFRGALTLPCGRRRITERVLLGPYPVLHPSIVCRRSTLMSVGGYREFFPLGEDDDLYFRLVNLHGNILDNLPDKLFYYRHYGSSITQRFHYSTCILMMRVLALSSEFRRRGFWDPLEVFPSEDCQSLRFRGISSFLFLQDSLEHFPSCPRARLYHLLRVVMILRRFGLKDFYHISLWNDWGMTLKKQIYFYLLFCVTCFRLRKFRAGFLYLRHALSLFHHVLFWSIAKGVFDIFSKKFNLSHHRTISHWYVFRYFILTHHWSYGLKHLFFAFCTSPFYSTKRLIRHSFIRFVNILYFPLRKSGI